MANKRGEVSLIEQHVLYVPGSCPLINVSEVGCERCQCILFR